MVMSRDHNAGRSHNNINTDNSSFERVVVHVLGNSLQKSKFYSGRNYERIEFRECLLSCDAEFFFFNLLSKNIKIQIYRTIILPVFCMGVKHSHSH